MMLISVPKADIAVRWLLWTMCQRIRVDSPTREEEELLIRELLRVCLRKSACEPQHVGLWECTIYTIILPQIFFVWKTGPS